LQSLQSPSSFILDDWIKNSWSAKLKEGNEKGEVKKIFSKVKPEDHAEEVLSAFNE
jgi:hypothetical protein